MRTQYGFRSPRITRQTATVAAFVIFGIVLAGCRGSETASAPRTKSAKGARTNGKIIPAALTTKTQEPAIAMDPAVRTGTLPNGLQYFIQKNVNTSAPDVEMRLVIKAGSVQERDDQSGIAHFLEHMLFNGTTKYPGDSLSKAVETFGGSSNAQTNFDRTVYEVTVPKPSVEAVATGVTVLSEWLSNATISEEEVAKERGVIVEERRDRVNSSEYRVVMSQIGLWFAGTSYGKRIPIGEVASIESMNSKRAKEFYNDWYRPDNAAVIVVGDVDVDAVEKSVREQFSSAANRGTSPKLAPLVLGKKLKPAFAVVAAKDLSNTSASITYVRPSASLRTLSDLKRQAQQFMMQQIVNTEFSTQVAAGRVPFRSAQVGVSRQLEGIDAFSLEIASDPDKTLAALASVNETVQQLGRAGLSDAKFEDAKIAFRSNIKAAADQKANTPSAQYVSGLVDHVLFGDVFVSIDEQLRLLESFLTEMKPRDVQAAINEWLRRSEPQIVMASPEGDAKLLPDANAAIKAMKRTVSDAKARSEKPAGSTKSSSTSVTIAAKPKANKNKDGTAFAPTPELVKETTRKTIPSLEGSATELDFSNGMRVIVNPTKVQPGKVALDAERTSGLYEIEEKDVASALLMSDVFVNSGAGSLDKPAFDRAFASTASMLFFGFRDGTALIKGTTTPANLEKFAQLAYVSMTSPRFDQGALDRKVAQIRPFIERPESEPQLAILNAQNAARYGTSKYFNALPDAEGLKSVSIESMKRVWADQFGNPTDWVVSISGDFTLDDGVRIAQTYFGSLKGNARVTKAVTKPISPDDVITKTIKTGTGDKSIVTVQYIEPIADDKSSTWISQALKEVLYQRLFTAVRETLGATYTPQVETVLSDAPRRELQVSVSITGDPKKTDAIAVIVQKEVAKLRNESISNEELGRAVAKLRGELSEKSAEMMNVLLIADTQKDRNVIEEYRNATETLNQITGASIREFAKTVLPERRYVQVVTQPE